MPFRNVLLVDDDDDDQEIFLSAARAGSPDVSCSGLVDARTALHKLENQEINPDVIFLDLNMPIMNGIQFLTAIKQRSALCDIPIIIFSTSSNSRTIQQLKDLGAHDFITKPANFNELVNILKRVLN